MPETRAAATTLRAAVSSLRTSMSTIRPSAPDRDGLRAALDDACARARGAGVPTIVDVPDAVAASAAALTAAVRFVREAVWNAAQHARATRIDVHVRVSGADLVVTVADDGTGFDPALLDAPSRPGHLGTTLLREVAEDTGGALELRTAPGAGTTWQLTVPAETEDLR